MIVAERKNIEEVLNAVQGLDKVLLVGCNTCVAVCMAGGEKEVAILASALRIAQRRRGKPIEIREKVVERQCDFEFLQDVAADVEGVQAVISMACGAGVQTVAQAYPDSFVTPAVNTKFLGITEQQGQWSERCGACGQCILDRTGAVCPITRCSKSLLNGPCGGSQNGKCEISKDVDCGWQLIHDRLQRLGRLELLDTISQPKDWSNNRDGGPRRVRREDMML